jgi:hypothetical protein
VEHHFQTPVVTEIHVYRHPVDRDTFCDNLSVDYNNGHSNGNGNGHTNGHITNGVDMEKLKFVSTEYQERLAHLAETVCTPERAYPEPTPHSYGHLAVEATVEPIAEPVEVLTTRTAYPDLPETRRLHS